MQSTVDSNSSFPLREVARHLDQAAAEKGIDALLARAQKNTEQAEQDAAVEAAQRAAEKATAMAQGAIGETVQNAAEVPVVSETTAAAGHSYDHQRVTAAPTPEYNVPPIKEELLEATLLEVFRAGVALKQERMSDRRPTAADVIDSDFGLAA